LRSFENNLQALTDAGIRVVAISVDEPETTRVKMVQEAGYTFTFLSDPKLEAIRRYDLVHAHDDPTLPASSGRAEADIARPAEFLVDPSGTIRWRMVTKNNFVRARPQQVLEAAKAL
jgi:peroxiredoxin